MIVTIYTSDDTPNLILKGGAAETKQVAKEVFNEDFDGVGWFEIEMSEEEFEKLPEFSP